MKRGSAIALLLGSRFQNPLRVRMFVSCVCYVGSGLCDWLITRTEECYRVSACVCDLETSTTKGPKPDLDHDVRENECDGSGRNLALNPSNLSVINT